MKALERSAQRLKIKDRQALIIVAGTAAGYQVAEVTTEDGTSVTSADG
jgi:hypothetical protein